MLALVITLSLVSGGLASILCPTVFDPNQTIHLPHPTSCAKFLTCVGSHPVEQHCPAGLHWDVEQSRCDYPRSRQCDRAKDSDQTFNAAAVANSVCLPQTQQCPLNSDPTGRVVFLQHRDCRKFYACVSTHPVELSCPPKLYWNSRSCACDYEMDAECDETMVRIEEDAPEQSAPEEAVPEESVPEESVPEEAGEEEHPIQEEDVPEEADQEQVEPEENDVAEASVITRVRRAADSASSSSNGTSSSSGSGSSGSGSSGSGSSGSGSSGPIQSGADIRSVSSIVMVVATVLMSTL